MDRRGFMQSLLGGLCAVGALAGIAGCPKSETEEDVDAPPNRMPDEGAGARSETPDAGEATDAEAPPEAGPEAIDTICDACGHEENRELSEIPGKCPKCGAMNAMKEEGAEITCRVCKHKWTPAAE